MPFFYKQDNNLQESIRTTANSQKPDTHTQIFALLLLSEAEVSKLLSKQPTTGPLDPISSHFLKARTHINTSHFNATFLAIFKQAWETLLLKKSTPFTSGKLQTSLSQQVHNRLSIRSLLSFSKNSLLDQSIRLQKNKFSIDRLSVHV